MNTDNFHFDSMRAGESSSGMHGPSPRKKPSPTSNPGHGKNPALPTRLRQD